MTLIFKVRCNEHRCHLYQLVTIGIDIVEFTLLLAEMAHAT